MTPRLKWLVLLGDGLVAIGGLIVALILSPLWFPILLWKTRQQYREAVREAQSFATEGYSGPRNSSDDAPPENYQA